MKYKAFFVGDGADRPDIEAYADEIGIKDHVIFTGAFPDREKIRAFFSRADLLLFPSTYDTSGLVVKEAAACGCASTLIAGSCAAEGVIDGVSGLLMQSPVELGVSPSSGIRTEEQGRPQGFPACFLFGCSSVL